MLRNMDTEYPSIYLFYELTYFMIFINVYSNKIILWFHYNKLNSTLNKFLHCDTGCFDNDRNAIFDLKIVIDGIQSKN